MINFTLHDKRTSNMHLKFQKLEDGFPEQSWVQDWRRRTSLVLGVQQGQEGEVGGPGCRDHRLGQGGDDNDDDMDVYLKLTFSLSGSIFYAKSSWNV